MQRYLHISSCVFSIILMLAGCGGGGTIPSAANTAPVAVFIVTPASGSVTTTFNFDAFGCTDAEDIMAALAVRWDWENDGTWDTPFSTVKSATHKFTTAGSKTVVLQVMDTKKATATTMQTVEVSTGIINNTPTAGFTITPAAGSVDTTFQFDASISSDTEDDAASLQVRWDWDGDGTWETPYSTTKIATHQFTTAGVKTIILGVQDSGGKTATTSQQVTVSVNTDPTASFTVTPASGSTDTTFQFNASGSHDAEDPLSSLLVRWDWESDGAWDTSYATMKSASHKYATAGNYTITLQVKDPGGRTGMTTQSLVVAPGQLTAISSFSDTGYVPDTNLQVTIVVTPATTTSAYAVEDMPPTGWTISGINESGTFDAGTGKVKWGPFFDTTKRTLTYLAKPPAATSGSRTFNGVASFDGVNVAISGARSLAKK